MYSIPSVLGVSTQEALFGAVFERGVHILSRLQTSHGNKMASISEGVQQNEASFHEKALRFDLKSWSS